MKNEKYKVEFIENWDAVARNNVYLNTPNIQLSLYPKELLPVTKDEVRLEMSGNFILPANIEPGKASIFHTLHCCMLESEDEWRFPNTYLYIENEDSTHLHINLDIIKRIYDFENEVPYIYLKQIYIRGLGYWNKIRRLERLPVQSIPNRSICIMFPDGMIHQIFCPFKGNSITLCTDDIKSYRDTTTSIYSCLYYDTVDDKNNTINCENIVPLLKEEDYTLYIFYTMRFNTETPYNMPATRLMCICDQMEDPNIIVFNKTPIKDQEELSQHNVFLFPVGSVCFVKVRNDTKEVVDMDVEEFVSIKNRILKQQKYSFSEKLKHFFINKIRSPYKKYIARSIFLDSCLMTHQSELFVNLYTKFMNHKKKNKTTHRYDCSNVNPIKLIRASMYSAIALLLYDYLCFSIQRSDDYILEANKVRKLIKTITTQSESTNTFFPSNNKDEIDLIVDKINSQSINEIDVDTILQQHHHDFIEYNQRHIDTDCDKLDDIDDTEIMEYINIDTPFNSNANNNNNNNNNDDDDGKISNLFNASDYTESQTINVDYTVECSTEAVNIISDTEKEKEEKEVVREDSDLIRIEALLVKKPITNKTLELCRNIFKRKYEKGPIKGWSADWKEVALRYQNYLKVRKSKKPNAKCIIKPIDSVNKVPISKNKKFKMKKNIQLTK